MTNGSRASAQASWPAIGHEAHAWVPSGSDDLIASRRARLQARGDYQAAVPPIIEAESVPLSPATAAMADDASQELARFDAEAGLIAAPFAAILLRTESASSSEIENLTSSAKQVALAEMGVSKWQGIVLPCTRSVTYCSLISRHPSLPAPPAWRSR